VSDFKFSNNYSDLSEQTGARAGFQFEFFCERCGDAWRSNFVPYAAGQASEWAGRAAGLFGGILGGAAEAIDGVSDAGYGAQHDKEFQKAIAQMETHFHRCPRCANYFCDKCWNVDSGLCLNCAPSAEVEIEAAYASGKVYGVGEKAANAGIYDGKQMDVKTRHQLVCPQCGVENEGTKFCGGCGAPLSQKTFCTGCGAEMAPGTKFCGECGAKQGE